MQSPLFPLTNSLAPTPPTGPSGSDRARHASTAATPSYLSTLDCAYCSEAKQAAAARPQTLRRTQSAEATVLRMNRLGAAVHVAVAAAADVF